MIHNIDQSKYVAEGMFIHAVLHKTCITHKMCCGRNIYLQIFADKGPTEIPVGPKGRAGVGEAEYKHRRGQKVDHSGRDSNPQPPDSKSDALPLRHRSVAVFTKGSILLFNGYTFSKIIGLAAHTAAQLLLPKTPFFSCHAAAPSPRHCRHLTYLLIGGVPWRTTIFPPSISFLG